MSEQGLFEGFDKVSKASWKQKILEDLSGKDFEQLVWQTREGYAVQPFYTEEDLENASYLLAYQNACLQNNANIREWENRETILVKDEKTANKEALLALNSGADGVCFEVSNKESCDLNVLLKGIYLHYCSVCFVADTASPVELANNYLGYAGKNIKVHELSGSIDYDPLAIWSTRGTLSDTAFEELAQMVNLYREAPNFRAVTINSSPFHNAGSHAVQELAFTLSAAVETINQLNGQGVKPVDSIASLSFRMATGSDYFTEIAKLKALRILFCQIARAYGLHDYSPREVAIHSVSSLWNKTAIDPQVNMLRNTTEAMAAILGGCNALSILPHDASFQKPSSFSKRIARNISSLLKEESYFNKVADPAAGSYYLENLTGQLAEHAWKLFQEIEGEGGYREAFDKGVIQHKIKAGRQATVMKTAKREAVIVGVNQYANPHMSVHLRKQTGHHNNTVDLLIPMRQSIDFEKVRLRTLGYLEKGGDPENVRFRIITLGPSSQAKARTEFASDFMATGGFTAGTAPFTSEEQAQNKAMETSAAVIILCGSDDDYTQISIEFIRSMDMKGKVLLLAAPVGQIPESIAPEVLPVYQGANAVEIFTAIQDKLDINP